MYAVPLKVSWPARDYGGASTPPPFHQNPQAGKVETNETGFLLKMQLLVELPNPLSALQALPLAACQLLDYSACSTAEHHKPPHQEGFGTYSRDLLASIVDKPHQQTDALPTTILKTSPKHPPGYSSTPEATPQTTKASLPLNPEATVEAHWYQASIALPD